MVEDVLAVGVQLHELRTHVITEFLMGINFFRSLRAIRKERLARIMQIGYFNNGEVVFTEGDAGQDMYILMQGRVEMTKAIEGIKDPMKVGETNTQSDTSWFGALALVSKRARRATATCREPTKLLVVKGEDFKTFLEIVPHFKSHHTTTEPQPPHTHLNTPARTCPHQPTPALISPHQPSPAYTSPQHITSCLNASRRATTRRAVPALSPRLPSPLA